MQENVDGRIIFTKILFDMGMPISYIGRMLCKDHSTCIHYRRKFDDLVIKRNDFRDKYYKVKDEFLKEEDISLLDNNGGLTKEVYMLRDSLGRMVIENEVNAALKRQIVEMKETIARLSADKEKLEVKMGLSLRPDKYVSPLDNNNTMNNQQEIERARVVSSMTDDYHESINDIYEMVVDKEYEQAKQEIKSLQADLASLLKYIDNDVRNASRPRKGA
jgi:ATP:corrinoid adenosyltransferase